MRALSATCVALGLSLTLPIACESVNDEGIDSVDADDSDPVDDDQADDTADDDVADDDIADDDDTVPPPPCGPEI